jgi:hypothetical protein
MHVCGLPCCPLHIFIFCMLHRLDVYRAAHRRYRNMQPAVSMRANSAAGLGGSQATVRRCIQMLGVLLCGGCCYENYCCACITVTFKGLFLHILFRGCCGDACCSVVCYGGVPLQGCCIIVRCRSPNQCGSCWTHQCRHYTPCKT